MGETVKAGIGYISRYIIRYSYTKCSRERGVVVSTSHISPPGSPGGGSEETEVVVGCEAWVMRFQ